MRLQPSTSTLPHFTSPLLLITTHFSSHLLPLESEQTRPAEAFAFCSPLWVEDEVTVRAGETNDQTNKRVLLLLLLRGEEPWKSLPPIPICQNAWREWSFLWSVVRSGLGVARDWYLLCYVILWCWPRLLVNTGQENNQVDHGAAHPVCPYQLLTMARSFPFHLPSLTLLRCPRVVRIWFFQVNWLDPMLIEWICSEGKDSGIEGFPLRRWSIEIYLLNEHGEQVPANLFDKVTYKLHPSFGDRAIQCMSCLFSFTAHGLTLRLLRCHSFQEPSLPDRRGGMGWVRHDDQPPCSGQGTQHHTRPELSADSVRVETCHCKWCRGLKKQPRGKNDLFTHTAIELQKPQTRLVSRPSRIGSGARRREWSEDETHCNRGRERQEEEASREECKFAWLFASISAIAVSANPCRWTWTSWQTASRSWARTICCRWCRWCTTTSHQTRIPRMMSNVSTCLTQ